MLDKPMAQGIIDFARAGQLAIITPFYQPLVADLSNFGQWTEIGSPTSTERATAIWKSTLRDHVAPANSGERVERIAKYIADKTAAGGAPPLD